MKFKSFLLQEGFNFANVEAGDILSFLQEINSDIENLNKKDLKVSLESLITKMRNLLNPKNDKRLVYVIQKIVCAIKDDIESGNDFKSTIESSVYELEKYFKDKKVVLNKPSNNVKDDSVSDPIKAPIELKSNQELTTPQDQVLQQQTPPLGSSGDNLSTIV
jgi:hypothetical protein